ncbi:hypothetical protein [Candidatus Palauibacter sp.]|uniref:hypothetical protein n=1 Tax=Candidatus Palauibacter sp. TaxID=3101350 RepID=UPI003B023902
MSPEMRQRLATPQRGSIAICFIAWIAVNGRLAAQTDRLILTESSRHAMAVNVVLHGGALSPRGGGSVFWSSDTVWIASPDDPRVHPICAEMVRAPMGAAFIDDGAPTNSLAVEIVDAGVERAAGPRLIRFSDGECRPASWTAPEPNRPLSHDSKRWVFVGKTGPGLPTGTPKTQVTLLRTDGHAVSPATIELKARWSDSMAVVLSGTSRGIIVTSRFFPFSWSATRTKTREAGRMIVAGQLPASNELHYANDPWVGTGVFALDSGFVQVLADLRSDRRHLVIYASSGAFKRRRVLDVPFGILDTEPHRHELLALRRTDRLEILTYQWSWQSTGPQSGPERRE